MLRVALKKTRKKKVKKFAFDHCKTCSERFVIWRDNFSFIFQRKEDKEMSEKRCYTVQELQEILGVSRPTIYNLLKKKEFRWIQLGIMEPRLCHGGMPLHHRLRARKHRLWRALLPDRWEKYGIGAPCQKAWIYK